MARFKGKVAVAGAGTRPDLLVIALVVTLLALAVVLLVWFLVDPASVRAFLDSLAVRR